MSSELPVTNGSLSDAFNGVNNEVLSFAHANSYGGPATIMDVAAIMAIAFSAMARSLAEDRPHPQTICPIPTNDDMAAAMQLLGYEYLRKHAPDMLYREVVGIPRSDLSEVLGWLEGALKCKDWEWSPDQHDYASQAYDRAMIFLNGRSPDDETQAKDPVAGI